MTSRPPLLEFRDVTRTFPGPVPVEALRRCSFSIAAGDLVTIIGPSGSGKSTLLNLAGLLDRPSSGGVVINDSSSFRMDNMPYGGVKDSGMGKEGPEYAIRELTEEKTIIMNFD